uniref:(northern house mosquito) hypothetical protein n=1 Tax=Culex pipiens TaxID=7175 RepID=A0A8D8CHL7_CULPI
MFCFPSLAHVCASYFSTCLNLREKKGQKHNLNSTKKAKQKKSSLNSHSFVIQNYTQNSLASGISHTNSLLHTHTHTVWETRPLEYQTAVGAANESLAPSSLRFHELSRSD